MNASLGYRQLQGILARCYAQATDEQAALLDNILLPELVNELTYQKTFNQDAFMDGIFDSTGLEALKGL